METYAENMREAVADLLMPSIKAYMPNYAREVLVRQLQEKFSNELDLRKFFMQMLDMGAAEIEATMIEMRQENAMPIKAPAHRRAKLLH